MQEQPPSAQPEQPQQPQQPPQPQQVPLSQQQQREAIELTIENEIQELIDNKLKFPVKYSKYKNEYMIEISFPQKLIDPPLFDEDIIFVMVINGEKFPFFGPRLYCLTQFSFPTIADGRDLLESVLKEPWGEKSKITDIIPLLEEFIKNYVTKNNIYVGKFYLGNKYDLRIINRLGCEMKNVKENIIINGKWTKFQRLLLISDIYFLLFEIDKLDKNKATLVFWAPINALLVIKKILVNKAVFIHWKQNFTYEPYEMCLTIDKGEEIVDLLLQKMQYFGLNYNSSGSKSMNEQKENEKKSETSSSNETDTSNSHKILTPSDDINIEKILEDIKTTEEEFKTKGESKEINEALYSLYIKAEKYYGEQVDTVNAEIYKKKRESIKV